MAIADEGKEVLRHFTLPIPLLPLGDCGPHPPSLERYEAARRLISRVPGADPEVIDAATAAPLLTPRRRRTNARLGIDKYLRLRRTGHGS